MTKRIICSHLVIKLQNARNKIKAISIGDNKTPKIRINHSIQQKRQQYERIKRRYREIKRNWIY